MLDYDILSKKPTLLANSNDEFIDLAQQTYNIKNTVKGEILIVNKYYVARPDLISLAVYGDDKYADIICKVNGISNPFELNEDDILFIPNVDELTSLTKVQNTPSSLVSESKKLFNDKKDKRKKISEKRSPNEMVVGEENYIIDHSLGLVFY